MLLMTVTYRSFQTSRSYYNVRAEWRGYRNIYIYIHSSDLLHADTLRLRTQTEQHSREGTFFCSSVNKNI